MTHHISKSIKVSLPAKKVWEVLNDYGGMEKFVPTVKSSPIVGDKQTGLGAKRKVTIHHDGSSLVEEIIEYDEGRGYKVEVSQQAPPIKRMQAELRVEAVDDESSEIYWGVDFEVKGGPLGWLMGNLMMKPIMKGVIAKAVDGLAYHSATGNLIDSKLPSKDEINSAIRPQ